MNRIVKDRFIFVCAPFFFLSLFLFLSTPLITYSSNSLRKFASVHSSRNVCETIKLN